MLKFIQSIGILFALGAFPLGFSPAWAADPIPYFGPEGRVPGPREDAGIFAAIRAQGVPITGAPETAQLCADPFRALCEVEPDPGQSERELWVQRESKAISSEAIRETMREARIKPRPDYEQGTTYEEAAYFELQEPEHAEARLLYSVKSRAKAMALLTRELRGFSASALKKFYAEVKLRLKKEVSADPALAPATKAKMLADLTAATFIAPADLEPGSTYHGWYNSICDSDGMYRNVYSYTEFDEKTFQGDRVILCTGQLMALLANPPGTGVFSPLYQVLAHELGHHIHAIKNWDAEKIVDGRGDPIDRNYVPAYAGYIACNKRTYAPFYSKHEPGDRAFLAELERALGRKPDHTDTHLPEISADHWGGRVLGARVAEIPGFSAKVAFVRRNLERLCKAKLDEGIHPTGRTRIELALLDPALRNALACKPVVIPSWDSCRP